MTKDWVHGIGHSSVCQILLQIVVRAMITSSPPAWTVPLGCCRLQLTSLSSMIVLQPPLICEGWGGHPLCLSGDSSVLMDLHWPCSCIAQSSILSIGSVSVALPLLLILSYHTNHAASKVGYLFRCFSFGNFDVADRFHGRQAITRVQKCGWQIYT